MTLYIQFMQNAADLQAAYRETRKAWAEEIGRPIPKRRKKAQHPAPAVIDCDADEVT